MGTGDRGSGIGRNVVVLFLLAAAPPLAAQAPSTEWRQFRGSPALTGASPAALGATPKLLWSYDAGDPIDSSAAIVDGKVYLGDEDGDVIVLAHSKEKKVLAEMNMGSAVYATVVPANGTIYLNNRSQLFAIANQ